MERQYLIDTNVISHLFADKFSNNAKTFVKNIVNRHFIISVAVEIEVLTYQETPHKMPLIEAFVNLATILPLDKAVTKKAIELRRNQGKLKLGDAIIGATAVVHNLILVSNNVRDFVNIKGLQLVDPHSL